MIQKKSEDAVSPVIGVMLLLVVTIVLATIVAAFAGGLGTETEPAPTTAVDVVGISDGYMTPGKSEWSLKSWNGVEYLPGKFDGTILEDNAENWDIAEFVYFLKEGVVFAREWNLIEYKEYRFAPYGSSDEAIALQNELMEESIGNPEHISEHTITLNCLHGDSLDLSKISIQVIYKNRFGEYVIKTPSNTFSGTLSAGDTIKLHLADDPNLWRIYSGEIVDVTIYYGNHLLVSEEKMTVSRD